jgi:Flp pilus assembly pilin Flp
VKRLSTARRPTNPSTGGFPVADFTPIIQPRSQSDGAATSSNCSEVLLKRGQYKRRYRSCIDRVFVPCTEERMPPPGVPSTGKEVNDLDKVFAYAQVFAAEAVEALRKREEGQTMAEYAVVLAVVTALVIGAITLLSGNIQGAITRVAGLIS